MRVSAAAGRCCGFWLVGRAQGRSAQALRRRSRSGLNAKLLTVATRRSHRCAERRLSKGRTASVSCKILECKPANATCSCSSIVRFATGPKRSMGHVLGAKNSFAARRRTRPQGGRAGLILSIPAQEVSLGSPRVGTIHVQAPTPQTPPLQPFLVDFSQQTTLL